MPRLALAIGGAALLVTTAYAASVAETHFGLPAALLVVGAVFGCGFLFRDRPRHAPRLTRPAPADPPVRVTKVPVPGAAAH